MRLPHISARRVADLLTSDTFPTPGSAASFVGFQISASLSGIPYPDLSFLRFLIFENFENVLLLGSAVNRFVA